MAIISNGTTIADAGAFSASLGSQVLIKTLTASSSSTLSFVHGSSDVVLDSTYPLYLFKFINIHPSQQGGDGDEFQVNFRDGGSSYDATKTSTFFRASQNENSAGPALAYVGSHDLAQSTGVQNLLTDQDADNDSCGCGELFLFNPSSTTFVKHYISRVNYTHSAPSSNHFFIAGYCNVTAAIDGVQFSMSAGTIASGSVKLYGIKDS